MCREKGIPTQGPPRIDFGICMQDSMLHKVRIQKFEPDWRRYQPDGAKKILHAGNV